MHRNLPTLTLALLAFASIIFANPIQPRDSTPLSIGISEQPCATIQQSKHYGGITDIKPGKTNTLAGDLFPKSLFVTRVLMKGEQLDLSSQRCEKWIASFTANGNAFRKIDTADSKGKFVEQNGWKERQGSEQILQANKCFDLPQNQDVVGCVSFKTV